MAHLRALPSIDALLQRPDVARLVRNHGHDAVRTALRDAVAGERTALMAGADSFEVDVADRVASAADRTLGRLSRGTLRPAINATGVVIHTNLGRAPLAESAIARVTAVARGYATLEYDLEAGGRGSRAVHAEGLLRAITGAEAGVVVNNNAAAMLLVLSALARGREVLISRGELVEIGGGFRVPDVMAQSGALLREVGTTNRTRLADYTVAFGPATALVLLVHPSNFRIEGFTERPDRAALIAAATAAGIPVVEDLGAGNLDAASPWEPTVQASIAAGVGLVAVSGDKLLGGPQAGIVVGALALVDRLRRHPLMRALRVDKLTYAALEATLLEHRAGRAHATVPVLRMLHAPLADIETRAHALADAITTEGWTATVVPGESTIGGGSAPGVTVPTALVRLTGEGWSADRLEGWLRTLDPPVIARVQQDAVVLDLRTVDPADDGTLRALLSSTTA